MNPEVQTTNRAIAPPSLRDVIVRGLRRRCPACGEGPMFTRWMRVARECSHCGARIAPGPGDTWGFWVLLDRLFVFVPIVLIYVGFKPSNPFVRIGVIAAIIGPLIWTMPHRMGLCVGLDFLTRLDESMPGIGHRGRSAASAGEDGGNESAE